MSALGIATLGVFCNNRAVALATLGIFCGLAELYANVGADGEITWDDLIWDDKEVVEIIQVILHSGILNGKKL